MQKLWRTRNSLSYKVVFKAQKACLLSAGTTMRCPVLLEPHIFHEGASTHHKNY